VFVGGISKSTTIEGIKAAFEERGAVRTSRLLNYLIASQTIRLTVLGFSVRQVKDVYLPKDKESGDHKGFAFVSFEDSSTATGLCEEGKFNVDGTDVSKLRFIV
jgi:RNA recognition motif-containing protein